MNDPFLKVVVSKSRKSKDLTIVRSLRRNAKEKIKESVKRNNRKAN